jgi:hypothetical protein
MGVGFGGTGFGRAFGCRHDAYSFKGRPTGARLATENTGSSRRALKSPRIRERIGETDESLADLEIGQRFSRCRRSALPTRYVCAKAKTDDDLK